MNPIHQKLTPTQAPVIVPFEIEQAMVGMEMGPLDDVVLEYMKFLSGLIRVKAVNCLHVLPKYTWDTSVLGQSDSVSGDDCLVDVLMSAEMKAKACQCLEEDPMRKVRTKVCQGSPLTVLVKEAQTTNADLIVIGQKHETTSKGILAKNLVRKTQCNALVIPKFAKHSLSKILVPIDFSNHSKVALQTAIAIQQQIPKVKIIAVHVYELPNFSRVNKSTFDPNFSTILEQDRMKAFTAFLQTHAPDHWEHIQPFLLQKDTPGIAYSIRDYALRNQIDFVVMGAKGHSEVELLMLGSVTEEFMSINKEVPTYIVKCC